jgi:formate hydrogenlyase transcriptional activator
MRLPGNIRELQRVDESWLSRQPSATEPNRELGLLKKFPSQGKAIIEAALSESGGRVYGLFGAAAKLGVPRSTLESKIRLLEDQQESLQKLQIRRRIASTPACSDSATVS